ncbi:MAG: phosphate ABC transporter substrate-binding protein [Kiritimatiellaceae bacterium]|nr:phosphate ABC transporter substrate-binding protein [Kiritimatiellaceae bacterium]
MKQMLRILVCGLILTAGSGCGKQRTAVTAAGSTAFQPFAEKLAEQFMVERTDIAVTVQGGGSALGVQAALSGAAQIGMADLVQLPPEAQELTAVIVARDGIAVVVNNKNLIKDLTMEQIRNIFSGKISNWKELGGVNHEITVVSREAGSGTRSSFEKIVKDVTLTKDAIIQDSNGTIRETVAMDENAVGYLSHGLLNEKIKAVTVHGTACTTEEVVAGRYPIVRPVYLLTKGEPTGACKAFIDYVCSAEGQKTIQESGLIPAK